MSTKKTSSSKSTVRRCTACNSFLHKEDSHPTCFRCRAGAEEPCCDGASINCEYCRDWPVERWDRVFSSFKAAVEGKEALADSRLSKDRAILAKFAMGVTTVTSTPTLKKSAKVAESPGDLVAPSAVGSAGEADPPSLDSERCASIVVSDKRASPSLMPRPTGNQREPSPGTSTKDQGTRESSVRSSGLRSRSRSLSRRPSRPVSTPRRSRVRSEHRGHGDRSHSPSQRRSPRNRSSRRRSRSRSRSRRSRSSSRTTRSRSSNSRSRSRSRDRRSRRSHKRHRSSRRSSRRSHHKRDHSRSSGSESKDSPRKKGKLNQGRPADTDQPRQSAGSHVGRSRQERLRHWTGSEGSEGPSSPSKRSKDAETRAVKDSTPHPHAVNNSMTLPQAGSADLRQSGVPKSSPAETPGVPQSSAAESSRDESFVLTLQERMNEFDDTESTSVRPSANDGETTVKHRDRYLAARDLLMRIFGSDIQEELEPVAPSLAEMGSLTYKPPAPEVLCPKLKRHIATVQNLQVMDGILETTRQGNVPTLKFSAGTFPQPKSEPYDSYVALRMPASSLPTEPIPIPPIASATSPPAQSSFCEAVSKSAAAIASSTNHLQWFVHATSKKLQGLIEGDRLKGVSDEVRSIIMDTCKLQEESWFSVLNLSRHVSALETNVVLSRRDRQMSKWRPDIPAHVLRKARCAKVSGTSLFNGAVAAVSTVVEKTINSKPRKEVILTTAAAGARPQPKQTGAAKPPRSQQRDSRYGSDKGHQSSSDRGGSGRRGRGRGGRKNNRGHSSSSSNRGSGSKGSDSKRRP